MPTHVNAFASFYKAIYLCINVYLPQCLKCVCLHVLHSYKLHEPYNICTYLLSDWYCTCNGSPTSKNGTLTNRSKIIRVVDIKIGPLCRQIVTK